MVGDVNFLLSWNLRSIDRDV